MLKSLFHWKVLVNILLAAVVFTALVWLTFRWLELHTKHGKEIPVPNVVNLSVHKAIEVLDDQGLAYEVDSFKFDPKFKPFQVLQIYPTAGSRVKDGRAILLKVNPRTYAPVQVPDILDRYKGLAFRQLQSVGLSVGDTIYEPNIQRDAVIRMQLNGSVIKPGTKLPRFSVIDLVIGTGPKRNVVIPNLVGLTVQEAKAIIANNLFEVGLVDHEDGNRDESDIVYYQDPEGGAIRDQGMQIDLWASKRNPAQLRDKIAELNSMYRIQMERVPVTGYPTEWDEPLPPVSQPEEQSRPNVTEQKPPQENTNGHKANTTAPRTSEQPAKTETKPKEQPKTEEKPKVRKVVVE